MVTNRQRYLEKVSQMITWGHWFAFFNILLSLALGSRYLFVSDWPSSRLGIFYALVSWLGHFSFIVFALYILVLFPLTFVVMSQRLMRFLSAVIATAGLTLLLVDTSVFTRFHLHLNPVVWELVVNPNQAEQARDWQLMFISVPVIFLAEMLFGTWCWQKLRSITRRRLGRPIAAVLISAFVCSHLIYIWADANFYRPVTMQRANFPLSYPMTARKFLEKHGLLNQQDYQRRLMQQGNPDAQAMVYPLQRIEFGGKGNGDNLLMIVVKSLRPQDIATQMPHLAQFANENIRFSHHYSGENNANSSVFSLFYGISPTYLDSVLAARQPSALIGALTAQGYQFGLFSSDGFSPSLYRQALLTDFSLPPAQDQTNQATTDRWTKWLTDVNGSTPWFSLLNYNEESEAKTLTSYQTQEHQIDDQIGQVLATLKSRGLLDKTIVVITAEQGSDFTPHGKNKPFDRSQWQVPLIIHWPGTPAQTINKLTSNSDVMRTLMQRMLQVTTPPVDYTQGEDLFAARRTKNWLATGTQQQLIIMTPTETIALENNGDYDVFNLQGDELKHQKPDLALLLQVLTDVRRFSAN